MISITRDRISVPVTETSQIGEARRIAAGMAEALGFDETARGQIAIVVTEIATNLIRHASGGEIVLQSLPAVNCCGLEILALDRGPGIVSMADALRDGFSTGTTAGTGLGAVNRLATTFDVYSSRGHGTAMVAQFHLPPAEARPGRVGWVCLPKAGERACGDACDVIDLDGGRTVILIADGLGHGLQAAEASRRAVQLFREDPALDGPRQLEKLHAGLRATRGAAVSLADIRRGSNEVRFTGIGNVVGRIYTAGVARGMVTQNGTVGAEVRRVQEFVYPWSPRALLIMHSDGLASQWQLTRYPGLAERHVSLIAGLLYRDERRERDDVTVLAYSDGGAA
ncbi:MAG: hypothetical protein JWM57_1780 [Phycisphaerales bacterium]|nr:hypothetical protein [Phycisphaerales bacterium]